MKAANAFGDEVKRLRLKGLRISLRDAAKRIGISNPYLSQIETGHRPPPPPPVVMRIADAYKADAWHLLGLAGYLEPSPGKREGRLQRKYSGVILAQPDSQRAMARFVEQHARTQSNLVAVMRETLPTIMESILKEQSTREYQLRKIRDDHQLAIDPDVRIEDFPPEAQQLLIRVYGELCEERFRRAWDRVEAARAENQKLSHPLSASSPRRKSKRSSPRLGRS